MIPRRLVGGRFDGGSSAPSTTKEKRGALREGNLEETGRGGVVMRRPLSKRKQENEAKLGSRTHPGDFVCRVNGENRTEWAKAVPLVSNLRWIPSRKH